MPILQSADFGSIPDRRGCHRAALRLLLRDVLPQGIRPWSRLAPPGWHAAISPRRDADRRALADLCARYDVDQRAVRGVDDRLGIVHYSAGHPLVRRSIRADRARPV